MNRGNVFGFVVYRVVMELVDHIHRLSWSDIIAVSPVCHLRHPLKGGEYPLSIRP